VTKDNLFNKKFGLYIVLRHSVTLSALHNIVYHSFVATRQLVKTDISKINLQDSLYGGRYWMITMKSWW